MLCFGDGNGGGGVKHLLLDEVVNFDILLFSKHSVVMCIS